MNYDPNVLPSEKKNAYLQMPTKGKIIQHQKRKQSQAASQRASNPCSSPQRRVSAWQQTWSHTHLTAKPQIGPKGA